MTRGDYLAEVLRQIESGLSAPTSRPEDWGHRANRYAMESLRDHVRDEWAEERKGLRARFHEGKVVGHTGPAHALLKAALALNEAAVHAVNHMLARPYQAVDDRVRDRLGLWLRPVAEGSVIVDLVCPPPAGHEHHGTPGPQTLGVVVEEAGSLQPAAVDQILGALDQSKRVTAAGSGALEDSLRTMGVHATRQLGKFAACVVAMRTAVDLDDRLPSARRLEWSVLDAQALRDTIKALDLDVDVQTYVGEWVSHSDVRRFFDLRREDGTMVSGTVPKDMADRSFQAVRKTVEIVVEEKVRDGFDDATVQYRLKELRVLD